MLQALALMEILPYEGFSDRVLSSFQHEVGFLEVPESLFLRQVGKTHGLYKRNDFVYDLMSVS